MAYRTSIFFVLLGMIACGDDGGGGGGTQNDAPGGTADGTMGNSDGSTDSPGVTGDAGLGATCGTTVCSATQECCLSSAGGSCVAQGTCTGVGFACDGPEDCSSTEVCCYGNEGGGSAGTGGSECKPTNQCQINACHVDTDCGGTTTKCCAVATTQYKVCLAQCPMM
jgi:hypothetical protein